MTLSISVGEQRAATHVAVEERSATGDCVVDLGLERLRSGLVDHRSHVERWIHRIAIAPGFRFLEQAFDKVLGDRLVDQHPLDRRAPLTGILVGTRCRERRGFLDVGVLHDNDRVVAAQFQHLPLVDRFRRDICRRPRRRECDEIDVGVRQHFVGDLFRVAGDDREHLGRQTSFVQDVGQQQRRQRCLLGGLQHHPVISGDRRRHLRATWFSGWLNGVIAEIAPSRGSRSV